jgi:hypothetical protein
VSFFWDGKGDRWGSIERNRAMQNKRQAAQLRHSKPSVRPRPELRRSRNLAGLDVGTF